MSPQWLEDIASRWIPGEGPVDIRLLGHGLVNQSYRVARAGRLYSLRLARPDSGDLGLDDAWECRVLSGAAAAGLAPVVHRCDPNGVLVADWVPGLAWTAAETRLTANLEAMAHLLRRVHALAAPEPQRTGGPETWIAHYSAVLTRSPISAARRSASRRAAAHVRRERLSEIPAPNPALCHSDLHRFNVAVGERLLLLDWEYAHVGDPYWDLAGWVSNNDGDEAFAAQFLTSYLERAARPEEAARLRLMMWLYDYVCLLWSEVYSSQRLGAFSAAVARPASESARATVAGAAAGAAASVAVRAELLARRL